MNVGFGLKVVIVERSTNCFWSNFVLSIPPVSFESISHRVGVTFRSHGTTQSLIFKKVNGAGPQEGLEVSSYQFQQWIIWCKMNAKWLQHNVFLKVLSTWLCPYNWYILIFPFRPWWGMEFLEMKNISFHLIIQQLSPHAYNFVNSGFLSSYLW